VNTFSVQVVFCDSYRAVEFVAESSKDTPPPEVRPLLRPLYERFLLATGGTPGCHSWNP